MQNIISIGEQYPNIAYLYALLGCVFLALEQVLFKYVTEYLTPFQIIVFRSVLLIPFNYMVLKSAKQPVYISQPSGSIIISI